MTYVIDIFDMYGLCNEAVVNTSQRRLKEFKFCTNYIFYSQRYISSCTLVIRWIASVKRWVGHTYAWKVFEKDWPLVFK